MSSIIFKIFLFFIFPLLLLGINGSFNILALNIFSAIIEDNRIIYRKVIYNEYNNSYLTLIASYLPKDKKFMDKIVSEMSNSINF